MPGSSKGPKAQLHLWKNPAGGRLRIYQQEEDLFKNYKTNTGIIAYQFEVLNATDKVWGVWSATLDIHTIFKKEREVLF